MMTLFDFINESPFWTLVFIFIIFMGIEECISAWKGKK